MQKKTYFCTIKKNNQKPSSNQKNIFSKELLIFLKEYSMFYLCFFLCTYTFHFFQRQNYLAKLPHKTINIKLKMQKVYQVIKPHLCEPLQYFCNVEHFWLDWHMHVNFIKVCAKTNYPHKSQENNSLHCTE